MPIRVNDLTGGTYRVYPDGTATITVPDLGINDIVNSSASPVTVQVGTTSAVVPAGTISSTWGREIGSLHPAALNSAVRKNTGKHN